MSVREGVVDSTLWGAIAGQAVARVALRFGGQVWTYGELAARVQGAVQLLEGRGVGAGDRVAVLALNHPNTLVLLFACARLGAMLVPLNWRLAAAELQWMLDDAEPTMLFVDGAAVEVGRAGTAVLGMDELPRVGGGQPVGDRDNAGHDDLLLIYTSGTTGRPKGAVLTGSALLANAALSHDMHRMRADDHVLTVLPLFHVGGLNIQTLPALLIGAAVTLMPRFEAGETLRAIVRDQPSLTVLVPATLQALSAHPDWYDVDLSSLRAVTTGSTVVQPAVTAPFLERGVPVLQVYGSTETAPVAIYTRVGVPAAPESTGFVGPGCAACAVDDAGEMVETGRPGEIWLRGPQLFRAYWRNPAATAEALAGGWYHTGDIGTQAADGSWTVHDRKGNLIVSGGENIYPAEIERVLHDMAPVAEAAVVGRPDARWQEVPEAFVVLRPGHACTEAEVIAHVHGELARFKAPRRVHFVANLPRNAMGKVQHALLGGRDEDFGPET